MTAARRRSRTTSRRKPDLFTRVAELARNLWWTWDPDAQRVFAALDPAQWEATNHSPLHTLATLTDNRRATLQDDPKFTALLDNVEKRLREYLRAKTWFQRNASTARKRLRVAYFCSEFALHESLPQYSGGLGVLAGDHLKSASDLGIPLVGVGLLYRHGYYRQHLRDDGSTHAIFPRYDFDLLPIHNTGKTTRVVVGRRKITARIWQVQVGRVPLYLLDTDITANRPADREITARLYGGDNETRIRQEILLGIGGLQALEAVGVNPTVFHLNEGHAAFCALERLRRLRQSGRTRDRAIEDVRTSTVFTTHTPVPAGHDRFDPKLMSRYFRGWTDQLDLSRNDFLALGRENAADRNEPFCMTVLALRLSARCNGVSAIHGRVSREMWTGVYDAKRPGDVPIGHVTNGVHAATWLAPEMRPLYARYLKPHWDTATPRDNPWQRANRIPPSDLWEMRRVLRRRLIQFVRRQLRIQIERHCEPLNELTAVYETLDDDALTIGFARRFATYKRAPLIFRDRKRLAAILNHADRPVQLLFAGKAHPADQPGQAFAQEIYQHAKRGGFRGRVVLLEDYDMNIGRLLTSGCDVWLNNPTPPQEASGTSGMKPPLHGGLNCSILDGWWPEAYNRRNGWAIGDGREKRTQAAQDRHDANAIYELLEDEIVPLFYTRDRQGLPRQWIKRMVASMQTVCPQFNTHRMLGEYLDLYSRK